MTGALDNDYGMQRPKCGESHTYRYELDIALRRAGFAGSIRPMQRT
jgi:hypothetical protein